MKCGFIGLGNMGTGMSLNLLKWCLAEGHSLVVHDLNLNAVKNLTNAGATHATTVASLVANCDVLFTSLPSAKEIAQIAKGSNGILQNASHHLNWFETSTNAVPEWEKLKSIAPESIHMIDAPVTGGSEGANLGTLTMLLGIDEHLLERHKPMLSSMTKKAIRMGPSCAGYVSKLSQLHLNYLTAVGIGEAMMMGIKGNLDLNSLYDVLRNSCAQSYVVDAYIPRVLDGSYDPSFALGLAKKDMRLITELGHHLDIDLTLGDSVFKHYTEATKRYGEHAPHLEVLRLIEDSSNQKLRYSNKTD